jgi:hypothetical protein
MKLPCPDFNSKWKIVANRLCTTVFDIMYSISHTSSKEITLDSVLTYEEMVWEAQTCCNAVVQIEMNELQVCL